jgi:hypothetical protein
MDDADLTDGNLLSNKMKINLHKTGALMLNRVGGEVHSADIVTVDKCASRRWGLELMEKLTQLGGLSHAVGNGTILSVIPRSKIAGTKPPYVCPGCFIHTYSNKMINIFHV